MRGPSVTVALTKRHRVYQRWPCQHKPEVATDSDHDLTHEERGQLGSLSESWTHVPRALRSPNQAGSCCAVT
jgi:hypothetical protein